MAATLTPANYSLTGVVSGETITVTQTVGAYNSRHVLTATTVTATALTFSYSTGAIAANYVLPTSATGPGHITPSVLTASILRRRPRPMMALRPRRLASGNYSLTGVPASETITVTHPAGTYNSKDVATATTVTATLAPGDFSITGTGAVLSDYTLPTTASGPGTISAKSVTGSFTASNKVYDGTPRPRSRPERSRRCQRRVC